MDVRIILNADISVKVNAHFIFTVPTIVQGILRYLGSGHDFSGKYVTRSFLSERLGR